MIGQPPEAEAGLWRGGLILHPCAVWALQKSRYSSELGKEMYSFPELTLAQLNLKRENSKTELFPPAVVAWRRGSGIWILVSQLNGSIWRWYGFLPEELCQAQGWCSKSLKAHCASSSTFFHWRCHLLPSFYITPVAVSQPSPFNGPIPKSTPSCVRYSSLCCFISASEQSRRS